MRDRGDTDNTQHSRRNGDQRERNFHVAIPFRDAEPGTGEIPLAQLDDFYTPGRDEKGAHQPIQFSLPPYMVRQMELILHSKRFPYLNMADLLRHAVKRHVHWTASIRESIPKHITSGLDSILSVCRDEEIRIKMEEVFNRAEKLAQYYLDKGEHGEAVRLLNTIKQQITDIPGGMWRNDFLAAFMGKWSPYLAGVGRGTPGIIAEPETTH